MEQTKGEVQIQKAGGSRIKKGGSMPWIVLGVAAAVLVGVYGGLCAVATYGGSLWRGTQILGQDVGGMTPEEAVAAVEASLEGREIGLYLYDSTLAAPPERSETPDASISLEDLGAEIDVPGLVELAEQQNQNGSILTSGWVLSPHFDCSASFRTAACSPTLSPSSSSPFSRQKYCTTALSISSPPR